MNLGHYALKYAIAEIGEGETLANNRGPAIERYGMGIVGAEAPSWCAMLASYCLIKASVELARRSPRYSSGALRLLDYCLAYGAKSVSEEELAPGDLVFYSRGQPGSGLGHVGFVAAPFWTMPAPSTGYITIEGNVGGFPSKVGPEYHRYRDPALLQAIRFPELAP